MGDEPQWGSPTAKLGMASKEAVYCGSARVSRTKRIEVWGIYGVPPWRPKLIVRENNRPADDKSWFLGGRPNEIDFERVLRFTAVNKVFEAAFPLFAKRLLTNDK